MPCEVQITPLAKRQAGGLRGPAKAAYEAFTRDLAQHGCEAMGYRLTGELVEQMCVRHLRGADRVVVAFPEPGTATIVLVGRHTTDDTNVYDLLYRVLGIDTVPADKRTKPACCDENGDPPSVDEELVDALSRRTREFLGRGA